SSLSEAGEIWLQPVTTPSWAPSLIILSNGPCPPCVLVHILIRHRRADFPMRQIQILAGKPHHRPPVTPASPLLPVDGSLHVPVVVLPPYCRASWRTGLRRASAMGTKSHRFRKGDIPARLPLAAHAGFLFSVCMV